MNIEAIPTTTLIFSHLKSSTGLQQNCERLVVPEFLNEAGVPLSKWTMIYAMIKEETYPIVRKCRESTRSEFGGSHHSGVGASEARLFELSTTLSRILTAINFLVNPHGIVAGFKATDKDFVRNQRTASWDFAVLAIEFKNMSVFVEQAIAVPCVQSP